MKQLMILIGLFTTFLLNGSKYNHEYERWNQYDFKIHKREYTFSTEFPIEYEGIELSLGVKSRIHLRTQYDLYDAKGEFNAQGVSRYFPSGGLGWFYAWAADIDVYDCKGGYIGTIDGTVYTGATAKYQFFDSQKNILGTAYLDPGRRHFAIMDSSDRVVVEMVRQIIKFENDQWTVKIFDDNMIPIEMIQIFAIFACDQQEKFLKDD